MKWSLSLAGNFGRDPVSQADASVFDLRVTCLRCGEATVWRRLPFGSVTRAALVDLAAEHTRCAPRPEAAPDTIPSA